MTEAFRTETVATDAGEYVIELFYDDSAENPLTDYDHPGMAFRITEDRGHVVHDTLSDADSAGNALRSLMEEHDGDELIRRYDKYRAITNTPWILVSGSGNGYSQSHWWNWSVLVDMTEWPYDAELIKSAKVTMDVYQTWARGEFVYYVVTDPDGEKIDSCYGIDNEDYALTEARDNVGFFAELRKKLLDNEAQEKMIQANLVGAGFVGLI